MAEDAGYCWKWMKMAIDGWKWMEYIEWLDIPVDGCTWL